MDDKTMNKIVDKYISSLTVRSILIIMLFPLQGGTQVSNKTSKAYQEFEKILAVYQSKDFLSYDIEYDFYESAQQEQPSNTHHMHIKQQGNNYYLKSDYGDLMHHDKETIIVNHTSKQVLLSTLTEDNSTSKGGQFGMDLSALKRASEELGLSLISFELSTEFRNKYGDFYKGLRFEAPEHSQTKMKFIYDEKTYHLFSSEIFIHVEEDFLPYIQGMQNTRIGVRYKNYKKEQINDNTIHASFKAILDQYYKKENGIILLKERYAAYELRKV